MRIWRTPTRLSVAGDHAHRAEAWLRRRRQRAAIGGGNERPGCVEDRASGERVRYCHNREKSATRSDSMSSRNSTPSCLRQTAGYGGGRHRRRWPVQPVPMFKCISTSVTITNRRRRIWIVDTVQAAPAGRCGCTVFIARAAIILDEAQNSTTMQMKDVPVRGLG